MTLNYNKTVASHMHNYLMQPGDMTLYRFGFSEIPEYHDSYVVAGGVGDEPDNYIFFYVNMPAGCGCGVVLKSSLRRIFEYWDIIHYLGSHGFEAVDRYTLVAVVLALRILYHDPNGLALAALEMRKAPEILARFK